MGHVVFCGSRLTGDQLNQILFEPSAWDLQTGALTAKSIYPNSDYYHPKQLVSPALLALPAYKKTSKDAAAQTARAAKIGTPPAVQNPEAFTMNVVNGIVFDKLVTLFAALVDKVAADGNWFIIDRVKSPSPTAELLLECALAQTTSRPTIVVLDSFKRLRKYDASGSLHAETARCIADLERLRATAAALPPAPPSTAKGAKKPKPPTVATADLMTFPQFYAHDAFLSAADWVRGDNAALPCAPEAAHINPRTKMPAEPVRVNWAYHYTRTIFGSGTHYLLYDEDEDVPDLRGLLGKQAGTVTINGESTAALTRIKKLAQVGGPLLMVNNTGGATQAFASLHSAMVEAKKAPDPKKVIKKIQLVHPQQRWTVRAATRHNRMCSGIMQRAYPWRDRTCNARRVCAT